MELTIEIINNPDNYYWIWKPKYSNKSTLRFIPSEVCNISSGQTVAVYSYENNEKCQIAQLAVPDYTMLRERFENGDALNLNYAYIDDYSWLGDKVPYEIEADPYSVKTKFTADCSIWNCSSDSTYYNQDVRDEKKQSAETLGEVLRIYRTENKMTQEFVAESLGVSRQAVSKWESGASDPSTTNLIALAKLYKIEPEELIRSITE